MQTLLSTRVCSSYICYVVDLIACVRSIFWVTIVSWVFSSLSFWPVIKFFVWLKNVQKKKRNFLRPTFSLFFIGNFKRVRGEMERGAVGSSAVSYLDSPSQRGNREFCCSEPARPEAGRKYLCFSRHASRCLTISKGIETTISSVSLETQKLVRSVNVRVLFDSSNLGGLVRGPCIPSLWQKHEFECSTGVCVYYQRFLPNVSESMFRDAEELVLAAICCLFFRHNAPKNVTYGLCEGLHYLKYKA